MNILRVHACDYVCGWISQCLCVSATMVNVRLESRTINRIRISSDDLSYIIPASRSAVIRSPVPET